MKVKVPGAIITLASVLYFVIFHWSRFLSDFWPPDKATVAPNILASVIQYAMIGVLAYVFYPPVRRAVDKWVENHLHKSQAAMHSKVDRAIALSEHIIKHSPHIPNEVPGHGNVTTPAPGSMPGESPATPPPTSPAGS